MPGSMFFPSFTYLPHSNKCSPQTLSARSVFALSPNPVPEMLLSCMSSNIAQISRWWVAKSILSRDFNQYPFLTVLHHPNNFIPSPWNQISDPANLAPLHIAQTLATTQDTLPIDRVPNTQVPSPSAYHLEPSILYIHHSQQTDLCNTHLPFLQNMKGYSGHQPKLVTQKRITNWTIHRHFILGVCNSQIVPPARNFSSQDGDITSRGTSKPVTGPFSPTKDDGDYNGTTPINPRQNFSWSPYPLWRSPSTSRQSKYTTNMLAKHKSFFSTIWGRHWES